MYILEVKEFSYKGGKTSSAIAKTCELIKERKQVVFITKELVPQEILERIYKDLGHFSNKIKVINPVSIIYAVYSIDMFTSDWENSQVSIVIDGNVNIHEINTPHDVYVFMQVKKS